jgi:hypothetical protein
MEYLSKSLWILYYKGEMFEIILENELYNKIIDYVSYDKVWLLLELKPITYGSLAIEEFCTIKRSMGWVVHGERLIRQSTK